VRVYCKNRPAHFLHPLASLALAPIATFQHTAMEAVFRLYHIKHFLGRQDAKELVVVSLLYLLQLYVKLVTLLYNTAAIGLGGRI